VSAGLFRDLSAGRNARRVTLFREEERNTRGFLNLAPGVCHVKLTPSAVLMRGESAIFLFFFQPLSPYRDPNRGRLLHFGVSLAMVVGAGGTYAGCCSISRAYKSRMGGTDMERHRRGWKETRLSKQRLVGFIAGRRRRDCSLSVSLAASPSSLSIPAHLFHPPRPLF
jgi:hypothetical protein